MEVSGPLPPCKLSSEHTCKREVILVNGSVGDCSASPVVQVNNLFSNEMKYLVLAQVWPL